MWMNRPEQTIQLSRGRSDSFDINRTSNAFRSRAAIDLPVTTQTYVAANGLIVELAPLRDYEALQETWLSLERLADTTFFGSWAWTGTWISLLPRESWPLVCRVLCAGEPVALAVLGRRRRRRLGMPFRQVLLNASGSAEHDSIHIEMNQLLAANRWQLPAMRAVFNAVARSGAQMKCDELLLPGLAHGAEVTQLASESGLWTHAIQQSAPYVDLDHLRSTGREYAALLGANGRRKVRRALTDYRRTAGEPRLVRAETAAQAKEFLSGLREFHQARWAEKGRSGAFAAPAFRAFHEALIRDHFALGCLDLFRVHCGTTTVGFVYAFRYRNVAYFYQCGFNYRALPQHNQPGYLALPMVIGHYTASGARTCELLAGEDDYKRRLATNCRRVVWLEVQRPALRTALLRRYRSLRKIWQEHRK